VQKDAEAYALELFNALGPEQCWLDVKMPDKSAVGMEEGVRDSEFFLCILSPGYFQSDWCLLELRWAIKYGKGVISTYPRGVNVGPVLLSAPVDVSAIRNVDSMELNRDPRFFEINLADIRSRAAAGGTRITAQSLLEQPLTAFLAALKLEGFAEPLASAGADKASDFLELTAEELTEMLKEAGLTVLQQKKLSKSLEEEKGKRAALSLMNPTGL